MIRRYEPPNPETARQGAESVSASGTGGGATGAATGAVSGRANEPALVRAVRRVVEIVPGERRLAPEYGCRVHHAAALRSGKLDPQIAAALLEEALAAWAPHLRIESLAVTQVLDDRLDVSLRSQGQQYRFRMKLRRPEGVSPPKTREYPGEF